MAAESWKTADRSAENAFRALLRTYGLVRRTMQPYFQRFGISGAQWGVLRALHRAEGEGHAGVRLGELGTRLLVRPPSVTGVVDRLARMGLVARCGSTKDLRVKHVNLTTAGRQLVERVLAGHAKHIQELLGVLSRDEQEQLTGLLSRLSDHLQGQMKPAEAAEVTD